MQPSIEMLTDSSLLQLLDGIQVRGCRLIVHLTGRSAHDIDQDYLTYINLLAYDLGDVAEQARLYRAHLRDSTHVPFDKQALFRVVKDFLALEVNQPIIPR